MPSNDIMALTLQGDIMWVATKNGIAAFRANGTPLVKSDDDWVSFTTSNSGLIDNRTKCLSVSPNGLVWVGTNFISGRSDTGSGVSVLNFGGTPFNRVDDVWVSFATTDGLTSNAVRALAVNGVTAWIGTNGGLSSLRHQSTLSNKRDDVWQTFTSLNRLSGFSVYAVAHTSGDTIWLGTEGGLSLLTYSASPHDKRDDAYITFTPADGLPGAGVRALASDSKGRLWIGTSAGLAIRDTRNTPIHKFDDVTVRYDTATIGNWPSDQINHISIDAAGRGWVSTGSYLTGGLVVLDPGDSLVSRADDLWMTHTTENSSLPDVYVRAAATDGSMTWVATQGGAARLNTNGTPFNRADDVWTLFTTANSGLTNNATRDIKIDSAKTAWFAHPVNGVSAHTANDEWVTFRDTDGLATNSVNTIYIAQDGVMWFGTEGGGVSQLNVNGTPTIKGDDGVGYPCGWGRFAFGKRGGFCAR
ncbi:MAG: hypothetical protein HC853_16035 [Anaerolineae bacterium]|nr:hypothetical protein [Anaerolineae bacterium]